MELSRCTGSTTTVMITILYEDETIMNHEKTLSQAIALSNDVLCHASELCQKRSEDGKEVITMALLLSINHLTVALNRSLKLMEITLSCT